MKKVMNEYENKSGLNSKWTNCEWMKELWMNERIINEWITYDRRMNKWMTKGWLNSK